MTWEEIIEEAKTKWNELKGRESDAEIPPEEANSMLRVADFILKVDASESDREVFSAVREIVDDVEKSLQDEPVHVPPIPFHTVAEPGFDLRSVFRNGLPDNIIAIRTSNGKFDLIGISGKLGSEHNIADAVGRMDNVIDATVYHKYCSSVPLTIEPVGEDDDQED